MRPHRLVGFLGVSLLGSALALSGCGTNKTALVAPTMTGDSGTLAAPQVPTDVMGQLTALQQIAETEDHGLSILTDHDVSAAVGARPVMVPAGSVDALAAAIAAAGPNGRVVLQRGLHTEHSTVAITRRVAIVGQTGAMLQSGVTPSNEIPTIVRPALYVHGAPGVMIWNVSFAPTGPVGGSAILLEDAPQATIGWNSFHDFQYTILLQNSNGSTVIGNRVAANTGWQSGDPIECDGIININGSGVRIAFNDVSGGLLNAFCSGSDGYYVSNSSHDGFVGMIVCDVPEGSYLLPSGAVVGSVISGTNWVVSGNSGARNFYTGLMVIDGANNNVLVNNGGSGNGAYDIELLGITCLFGFETPTSFNNKVFVGAQPGLTINDFGLNNTIIGSATVTHNVSAPCSGPAAVRGAEVLMRLSRTLNHAR